MVHRPPRQVNGDVRPAERLANPNCHDGEENYAMDFLKRVTTVSLVIVAVLLSLNRTSSAQWLNHPDRRTPRTPDGKPDLAASAPRTPDGHPDLSGIWRISARGIPLPGQSAVSLTAEGIDVPFQAAARALYKQRVDNQRKDMP